MQTNDRKKAMKQYKITLTPEPNQSDRHTLRVNDLIFRTMDKEGVLKMQKILNDYVIMQGLTHDEK